MLTKSVVFNKGAGKLFHRMVDLVQDTGKYSASWL